MMRLVYVCRRGHWIPLGVKVCPDCQVDHLEAIYAKEAK
jgi:hypothetical protein